MKKYLFSFLVIISFFQICCSLPYQNAEPIKAAIFSFDLSPNDKEILYEYEDTSGSTIFTYNISTKLSHKILSSKTISYYCPRYSPDGKSILYLVQEGQTEKCGIFLMNTITKISRKIFVGKNIMDAIYDTIGRKIYFTQADTFANYSPVASKGFHGMDIYSISTKDSSVKRVTNFNAYSIGALNNFSDNELIFTITINQNKIGMYLLNINNPEKLIPIDPINKLRVNRAQYFDPVFNPKDNRIVFSTNSEIFMMGKDRLGKTILRNDSVNYKNFQFYHNNRSRVIFISYNGVYSDIQAINSDGTDFTTFNILK